MSFARFSSWSAYLAAVAGLAYSVTFVATTDDDARFGEGLEGAFLLAGGVLAVAVFAALYERVRETLGAQAVAGFFCGGEIGPVGGNPFLHGFTATLAVFLGR